MVASGLVRRLRSDRVDVVGDVHGEIGALRALLARLGVDVASCRAADRPVVFVGDLVDRGPDSVAVVELVERLVQGGIAEVVLGNHELNLLARDQKEGNGWFLHRGRADAWHCGHCDAGRVAFDSRVATSGERRAIREFLWKLPVALEAPDLRVVHAAWNPLAIEVARRAPSLRDFLRPERVELPPLDLEGAPTREALVDPHARVEFHEGLAKKMTLEQNGQPAKVLTSGIERPIPPGASPRWLSGKWRLLERDPWWEADADERSVVFGHYWRRRRGAEIPGKADPLDAVPPAAWFGRGGHAFCVDYSVGYRLRARHAGVDPCRDYGLAALRWPERLLVFDDGDAPIETTLHRAPSRARATAPVD